MIDMTTHLVEDIAEVTTKCDLTSLKDRPDDDCSLDINECTCPKCLSLVIADLTTRLKVTHYIEDVAEMQQYAD